MVYKCSTCLADIAYSVDNPPSPHPLPKRTIRQTDRRTHRQTNRQTDRQTDTQTDMQTDRLYRVFNDYTDMTKFSTHSDSLPSSTHPFLHVSMSFLLPHSLPLLSTPFFFHPILNSVFTFPFSVPVSSTFTPPLSVRFSLSTIFLLFRHYFSGLVVYSKKVTNKYECQPSNLTRTLISALLS